MTYGNVNNNNFGGAVTLTGTFEYEVQDPFTGIKTFIDKDNELYVIEAYYMGFIIDKVTVSLNQLSSVQNQINLAVEHNKLKRFLETIPDEFPVNVFTTSMEGLY